jgi:hypothetical protein
MSVLGSDETPNTLADQINAALIGFTGCIGGVLEDICTYSLTFGETYVPFSPDEDDDCGEDEEEWCSQAWVRVTDISVAYDEKGFDSGPSSEDGGCEGTCGGTFRIGLEVGILRCYEIPEKGEAPTATQTMAIAMQSMIDMSAIYQAAMNCEVWQSIDVGQWQPEGPLGGQFGGYWNFTVEL